MTYGCTTFSLLELGCADSDGTASARNKVSTTYSWLSPTTWTVTSKVATVNDLFVKTESKSSHTVTFNGSYNRLSLNTAPSGYSDTADRVTFNGTVNKSTVSTGNSYSTSGDNIQFNQTVTNTTVTASRQNDEIIFAKSAVSGTTVNAGNGHDSIRFLEATQVGAGNTLNLGGASASTGDGVKDIIFLSNKNTFVSSGITINNFVDNTDEIRVGATIFTTKAAANAEFGAGSIIFG